MRGDHHAELHFNSVGLSHFKCSCGVKKSFHNGGAGLRHFSWSHLRSRDQARVRIEDFFDAKPVNRPSTRGAATAITKYQGTKPIGTKYSGG